MTDGEHVEFEKKGRTGTAVAYELRDNFYRVRIFFEEPGTTRPVTDINVTAGNAYNAVDKATEQFFEAQRE